MGRYASGHADFCQLKVGLSLQSIVVLCQVLHGNLLELGPPKHNETDLRFMTMLDVCVSYIFSFAHVWTECFR